MSCASQQRGSRRGPETFVCCKEGQKGCCWSWLHFISVNLVPGLSSAFVQNVSAAQKGQRLKPLSAGNFSKSQAGFAGRAAHLQHRTLRSRLYFQWCLRQFWGLVGRSNNSQVICFLTCSFIALLLRSLWSRRLATLQTGNFQGGSRHFFLFLPDVAYERMSSPLSLNALWRLTGTEQLHRGCMA